MGYCGIIDNLRVLPSSHARWKLFLICTMLCFCGYFIYYKFGDRLTAFPVRRASQGVTSDNNISRGLLHDKNDGDYAGEELEEVESDDGLGEDLPHETFPMMRRRLPQVIIIGVKKGGTQALLDYLRLHPDVVTAGGEPHFFNRHYEKGLDWYRNLMPKSTENQITTEKTPAYFITKEVPARIHAMSNLTKLLLLVRDPVIRVISDYAQDLTKKSNIPSFETMAFKNMSAGVVDSEWINIQVGLYANHLVNWIQYFPLKRLLVVDGDRLIREPAAEFSRVQDFLGLRKLITEKNFVFDTKKGFYCTRKAKEDYKIPHCLGKGKGRAHPVVRPELIQQLKKFYKPFNRMFYKIVGQDFGWD